MQNKITITIDITENLEHEEYKDQAKREIEEALELFGFMQLETLIDYLEDYRQQEEEEEERKLFARLSQLQKGGK